LLLWVRVSGLIDLTQGNPTSNPLKNKCTSVCYSDWHKQQRPSIDWRRC
jgi:hypothetical protein